MSKRSQGELARAAQLGEAVEVGEQRTFNPVAALRKYRERRSQVEAERIAQLSEAVALKLFDGITEKGMVSLFHDKVTGVLQTEMYSAIFCSPVLPRLSVLIWRDHTKQRFNNHQLSLTAIESSFKNENYRAFSVERTWTTPQGESQLRFSEAGTDEGQRDSHVRAKPIPNTEKIQFLEEILASEVDVRATEEKFGAAYTPGGIRPISFHVPPENADTVFSGYWVRDLKDQLPALPGAAVGLINTSVPAVKA